MGDIELQLGEGCSEFYVELVHDILSCRECWFDGPFVVLSMLDYHIDCHALYFKPIFHSFG